VGPRRANTAERKKNRCSLCTFMFRFIIKTTCDLKRR
jgi:hypothetical protein